MLYLNLAFFCRTIWIRGLGSCCKEHSRQKCTPSNHPFYTHSLAQEKVTHHSSPQWLTRKQNLASYPPAPSVKKTAAFYPKAASVKENHAGIIDYYHNTQAEMETESNEHCVSNRDQGNLSVLAFAAMLGNEALEDN